MDSNFSSLSFDVWEPQYKWILPFFLRMHTRAQSSSLYYFGKLQEIQNRCKKQIFKKFCLLCQSFKARSTRYREEVALVVLPSILAGH